MSDALQQAIFRFVALVVAIGVAGALYLFIPVEPFKSAAAVLGLAAIMGLEEFVKGLLKVGAT